MSNIAIIKSTDYPEDLCCPISHELMVEPVIMSDGHTYDKENIEKWLKKSKKSPLTNEVLKTNITINYNLKKVINDYKENNNSEVKKEFYIDDNNCVKFKDNNEKINLDNVKLIYTDFTYEGSVIEGKFNNKSIMKYSNGNIYDGNFENGNQKGLGIMKYCNGDIYDGNWFNDEKNGKGIMKYSNGDIYDGEWFGDEKHGKGIMTYKNGDIYDGEWDEDSKNGKGIMYYHDFSKYNGEWCGDEKHGNGVMTNIIDETYTGEWIDDKKQGEFKIRSKKYELLCKFNDDQVEKEAQINYFNGDRYKGEINNKLNKHGLGIMKYDTKYKSRGNRYYEYIGQWNNNIKKGKGIMKYRNGDIYDGEWENDFRNGKGILKNEYRGYYYNGTWYEGIMKYDELYTKFNGKIKGDYNYIE